MSERAQTFTLESVVAAILLVATVAFTLQAVSITSNTASAADSELQGQHAALADGVLDSLAENETLRTTLAYWNESAERFHWTGEEGVYISPGSETAFGTNTTLGESLEAVFDGSQVRYNVNLYYRNESGDRQLQRLVESGTPGHDAVRVVETVTLYTDTVLVDEFGTPRENTTLSAVDSTANESFYAPNVGQNASEGRSLYTVIRVEVVIWQT